MEERTVVLNVVWHGDVIDGEPIPPQVRPDADLEAGMSWSPHAWPVSEIETVEPCADPRFGSTINGGIHVAETPWFILTALGRRAEADALLGGE